MDSSTETLGGLANNSDDDFSDEDIDVMGSTRIDASIESGSTRRLA